MLVAEFVILLLSTRKIHVTLKFCLGEMDHVCPKIEHRSGSHVQAAWMSSCRQVSIKLILTENRLTISFSAQHTALEERKFNGIWPKHKRKKSTAVYSYNQLRAVLF